MNKIKFYWLCLSLALCSVLFSSCIGSFSLTKSVMDWNHSVGKKFLNEIVFVAFWILPVYEVTAVADLLILNSIEFWKGKNPVSDESRIIETEHGKYKIDSDEKGYTITHLGSEDSFRLEYHAELETWSFVKDGQDFPFLTFIDDNYVKMITPEGDFRTVELSEKGVMAYRNSVLGENAILMASL